MAASKADDVLKAVVLIMIQRNYTANDSKGLRIAELVPLLDAAGVSSSQPSLTRYFASGDNERYGLLPVLGANHYGVRYYYDANARANFTAKERNVSEIEAVLTRQAAKEIVAERSPSLEIVLNGILARLDAIEVPQQTVPWANKTYAEFLDMIVADIMLAFDSFAIVDWTSFVEDYGKRNVESHIDANMTTVIARIQEIARNVQNNKTD